MFLRSLLFIAVSVYLTLFFAGLMIYIGILGKVINYV